MKWSTLGLPNPGSDEALIQGCTCPVIDNHHGRGIPAGHGTPENPVFWVDGSCPIHADTVQKGEPYGVPA